MFRAIVWSAAIAGIAAGLLITAIHAVTTTPLILAAETYEQRAAPPAAAGEAAPRHDHAAAPSATWAPSGGLERLAYSGLANIVTGVGFGLILTACFGLAGRPVDARSGVMWGAAGFAVFTLAPNLGLPPELPGMASPDLAARQLWWSFAAAGAAAGLWLLAFGRVLLARVAGVIAIALPQAIGAPHADQLTATVPPELAAHFAAASIVTSAVFWAVLGCFAGTLFGRFRSAATADLLPKF